MSGPRDYARSTIFALATLGEGRCYWPQPPCSVPVTVFIDGEPVSNLQIAHIRAAKANGPRYVPSMSDDERRAWSNLILLCTPHHNMIDKLKPNDYSIEDLERWKNERETGGLARLRGLNDLTEDRLQEMIAYSVKEAHREIRAMLDQSKPIDPDAAMLLSEAARHLNITTAETLYEASWRLAPALNDYTEMLFSAARALAPALNEHTNTLSDTARVLAPTLNDHAETLHQVTRLLGQFLDRDMEILLSATRDLKDLLEGLDEKIWQLRRFRPGM